MSQIELCEYDKEINGEHDYECTSKKNEDEKYYRKFLVFAIIMHLINAIVTIGFSVAPFQIRKTTETSTFFMSSFLVVKDSNVYNLYDCIDNDGNDECNLDLLSFSIDQAHIRRFRSLSIFVSIFY